MFSFTGSRGSFLGDAHFYGKQVGKDVSNVCVGGGGNMLILYKTKSFHFASLLKTKLSLKMRSKIPLIFCVLGLFGLWFQPLMKEPYVWRMILAGAELGASHPYFHFSLLLGPIYYLRALFYWLTKHRLFFWICVQGINFYLEVKTITSLWRDEDAEALKAPTAFPTMK